MQKVRLEPCFKHIGAMVPNRRSWLNGEDLPILTPQSLGSQGRVGAPEGRPTRPAGLRQLHRRGLPPRRRRGHLRPAPPPPHRAPEENQRKVPPRKPGTHSLAALTIDELD